jgi:hypothetical protein
MNRPFILCRILRKDWRLQGVGMVIPPVPGQMRADELIASPHEEARQTYGGQNAGRVVNGSAEGNDRRIFYRILGFFDTPGGYKG